RSVVLRRDFLPALSLEPIGQLGRQLALGAMYYTPEGIWTSTASVQDLEFYTRLTGLTPKTVDEATLRQAQIHKIVWVGSPQALEGLSADIRVARLELPFVRSHDRLFELLPIGVTKASGLQTLAQHLGVRAEQTVVFGDADNDLPMFEWAGESVAMPHGTTAARKSARWVGPRSSPQEAFACAVDFVLSRA
ncbi:MAG: HAD-IIB family hydrolase, partial [Verrucomicrobiota bacterium]